MPNKANRYPPHLSVVQTFSSVSLTAVPLGFRKFEQRLPGLDSGVVHQNLDTGKFYECLPEHTVHVTRHEIVTVTV